MVVEALIGPRTAERNPSEIIVLAFIFVSLAVGIVDFLKIEPMGAMLLMFTLIPALPFILNLFKLEEEELEHETVLGSRTIRRHYSVLLVLLAFFIGMTIAFTFWYLFIDGYDSAKAEKFFGPQLSELKRIGDVGQQLTAQVVGNGDSTPLQGAAVSTTNPFLFILKQNLGVLGLVIMGSLIYGAGSVFILIWNASIIGVFLGNMAKKFVLKETAAINLLPDLKCEIIGTGFPPLTVLKGLFCGFLGLIPHGTFELIAYSAGALAGGILSSAITREAYNTKEFRPILKDVIKLVMFSVACLFVGAFIESTTF